MKLKAEIMAIITIMILVVTLLLMMAIVISDKKTIIQENQTRINNQSDIIRDMTVIVKAYDELIIENESLNREFQQYKENQEMINALIPLRDYMSDDEILDVMKEIPHGYIFRDGFDITSFFGESIGWHGVYRTSHKGVDITAKTEDWLITPLSGGESVQFAIDKVYGKSLTINHSERVQSFYAHGSNVYNRATVGRFVESDTIIMKMGNTGMVYSPDGGSGAHLHFEIRVMVAPDKWIAIDPLPFLDRN